MNLDPSDALQTQALLADEGDPLVLTPMDVDRLLHNDSPESRAIVLNKIAKNYNEEGLKSREREVAEQIFRLLMRDVALHVRESLAERIKGNATVPRDIILHLANDVETVAIPILATSSVLSDADLVSIVEQSPHKGKLVAISQRETVSTRVSDALVETRYAEVMTSLLSNDGAIISERALEKIAEDFRGQSDVMEVLSRKPQLPLAVVERIIAQVGEQVAARLREKYKINEIDLKKSTAEVREDFMLRLMNHDMSQEEIESLVLQMSSEERLTHSIVMTALCRGQLLFFTIAIAHFSNISVANAMRLFEDRGEHGFNRLYDKSGLPESMRDAIRLLLRAVQEMSADKALPGSVLYANRLAERVVASAGTQSIEYLPYFIALIRQNVHRPPG